jgi:hypothetical protein
MTNINQTNGQLFLGSWRKFPNQELAAVRSTCVLMFYQLPVVSSTVGLQDAGGLVSASVWICLCCC